MFSLVARERSATLVSRLTSNLSSRFKLASNPNLINAAFFSEKPAKPEKPKHVKKPRHIGPGHNPLPRVKIYGSTLKLKFIDPIKIEAKIVKLEINAIFKDTATAQAKVDTYIAEKLADIDIPRIANLMRVSAQTLTKEPNALFKSHMPLLTSHMPAIARRIDALSTEPWEYKHIAFVIYGMQFAKEKDRHYLSILSSMAKVAKETLKGNTPPLSQDIAMILLGMQYNDPSQVQSVNMLTVINEMLAVCKNQFDAQCLSNAFYGLKSMDESCPEAMAVLSSLTPRVQKCEEELTPQQVSFAICGLQGMRNKSPAVLEALNALAPRVKGVPKTFRPQHAGNSLLGLQKMNSESPEVLNLMNCLVTEFAFIREDLKPTEIKKVLLGTKKMGNKCPQVRSAKIALGLRKFLDVDEDRAVDDKTA
jgi:hypothetical protein